MSETADAQREALGIPRLPFDSKLREIATGQIWTMFARGTYSTANGRFVRNVGGALRQCGYIYRCSNGRRDTRDIYGDEIGHEIRVDHVYQFSCAHNPAMTVPERVTKLLRDNPGKSYCDRCIHESLSLARHQQAQQAASALGTTSEFDRSTGTCSLCGGSRVVTSVVS